MANVNFKRGLLSQMPEARVDGTIYITTDEGAMYVDTATKRVRLGDFIPVDRVQDLPAAGHAYETAVYYVKDNNILARWDAANSRWIQINKAGIARVIDDPENDQSANVVSAISTTVANDGTLTLVVSKQTVATSQDLADLAAMVASHTTSIATITGNGAGSINKAVADAREALLGDASEYTTIGELEDAINDLLALSTQVATNTADIQDLQSAETALGNRITATETAITTLNGDASTAGSVAKAVADEATLRIAGDQANSTAITDLDGRMDDAESDIGDNAAAIAALQAAVGTGDSGLAARVAANEAAIGTLNGTADTAGSVLNTVNSRIATVVADAPEAFDTLKEIADWIGNNSDDALTMQANISDNAAAIAALQTRATNIETAATALTTRVTTAEGDIDAVEAAITTLNAGESTVGSVDYKIAQALTDVTADLGDVTGDINGLKTRMTAAETALTTLNGDANTAGSVAKAVADERTARTTAEAGLQSNIDNLSGRMDDAETDISALNTSVNTIVNQLTWVEFA